MARPKKEEVVTEVEKVVLKTAPVLPEGIKTSIVSINIDGKVYEAKGGYISVPSAYVELVKSHG